MLHGVLLFVHHPGRQIGVVRAPGIERSPEIRPARKQDFHVHPATGRALDLREEFLVRTEVGVGQMDRALRPCDS